MRHIATVNGVQAWQELTRHRGRRARQPAASCAITVQLVLTDVEMPEMDGYMLAKQHQGRPALRGHAGDHALVAVG